MSVRKYNPSVRVGNWNEDLCLEEDLLKDFLEKKENGELLICKSENLYSKILQPVVLSHRENDGLVRFGDRVCLYNPVNGENLSVNISTNDDSTSTSCGVTASSILHPCFRNTVVITSHDGGNTAGDCLCYGQHFMLSTLPDHGEELKLCSDRATFMKSAKKSRYQEVCFTSNISYLCHWQVQCLNPRQRFESEGAPVKANQRVVIKHCYTNQGLAALSEFSFRTAFGREHEVVAHTLLDSHKTDKPENHWVIVAYDNKEDIPK